MFIRIIIFILSLIISTNFNMYSSKYSADNSGFQVNNIRNSYIINEINDKAELAARESIKKHKVKDNTGSKPKEYEKNKIGIRNYDFEMGSELSQRIYTNISNYGKSVSFYAVSLKDRFEFGYNPKDVYETASTIKAPYILYCIKEIEKGNGTFDELKVYEQRHFIYGSGIIQNTSFGSVYTLKQLIYYTINFSDNIAYNMLYDRFGIEGYNNMLEELGCKHYYMDGRYIWGKADPESAALVWQEIYKYSKRSEYGKYYLNLLINALYNFIAPGVPEYVTAHKSGWIEEQSHDTGIVFGERPYTVVIMVENGGSWSGTYEIQLISSMVKEVMDQYDIYSRNMDLQKK